MISDPQIEQTQRHAVLRESVQALSDAGIPFLAIGSIAGTLLGEADWDHEEGDVDFLVLEQDVVRAQDCLVDQGFSRQNAIEKWLLKAGKHDVVVDLIFELYGGVRLDQDMLARAVQREMVGVTIPVMPPEDYAISQAMSARPITPEHWYNAFGVLKASDLDWGVVLRRSEWSPDRTLSLVLFARSAGVTVPEQVVRTLANRLTGS